MPMNFRFLDGEQPAVLLPIRFDRNKTTLGQFSYDGIARLKPGVTLKHADAHFPRILPTVRTQFP